jgi:hypothetical protein
MRFHEIIAERQQQLYLRLGDLPEGGKSAIGAAPNIYKHIERAGRTHEAGVSVYPVEWDPEINRFVIDCNNLASLDGLFGQRRPAYIVTGRRIGKYGMDSEPLLRDVKIVKEVPYNQLNVPGWGSTPQPEDFLIDYDHHELDEDASNPAFRPVKNPSDRQIVQMVQRAKEHRLRGIMFGQDFWLWDAYYAIHKQAADAIGVPYWPDGKDNRIAVNDEGGYPVFDFPSDDSSIQEYLMSRFKNSDDIFFQCGSYGLLSGKEAAMILHQG